MTALRPKSKRKRPSKTHSDPGSLAPATGFLEIPSESRENIRPRQIKYCTIDGQYRRPIWPVLLFAEPEQDADPVPQQDAEPAIANTPAPPFKETDPLILKECQIDLSLELGEPVPPSGMEDEDS